MSFSVKQAFNKQGTLVILLIFKKKFYESYIIIFSSLQLQKVKPGELN